MSQNTDFKIEMHFLHMLAQFLFIHGFLCNGENSFSGINGGLVAVAVIYRHGDRTPVNPYPNDPYKNASYWPVDFGQLTNRGKMQHFQLGQWLRNRYKDFLSDQYSEKDIYVKSTNVDRTLMSAEANLAGLYPPLGNQVWNNEIRWQPIPIHTTDEQEDNILAMKKPCTRYNFLESKLQRSPEMVRINTQNRKLYEYLSHNTGMPVKNVINLEYIYNTLMIETLYNLTLPNWTSSVYPDKMKPWAELSFALQCYTPEMARLKVGLLLNDVLEHLTDRTNNSHKFLMYSGHDTTIANLLMSLNAFEYHLPPYAATVIFELRRFNNSYFMNVLYKNTSEPQHIVLKGCTFLCPLEEFKHILQPIRLTNKQWESECKIKFLGILPFGVLQNILLLGCTAFLFLLVGGFAASVICKRVQPEKQQYMRLPIEET